MFTLQKTYIYCRLDHLLRLKISDYGISRECGDYYRSSEDQRHAEVPHRWMSPEALTEGYFSQASDVVGCNMKTYIRPWFIF